MAKVRETSEELKKYAHNLGLTLAGIADISKVKGEFLLAQEVKDRFDVAICLGMRLLDSVLEEIKDKPTSLYFHHYRQINFFLDRAAFLLASHIQELGYRALPIPASQIIDWENQKAHLSHKIVGHLAGFGWIGRNNLLVNPLYGARLRLVTVLTDIPLDVDRPLMSDCGQCLQCLSACPAMAIKEKKEEFDHHACYAKLDEFRRRGLVGQRICGVCVKACHGKKL